MRGEQSSNFDIRAARSGSPPLARGTASYRKIGLAELRITPACAGNRVHYPLSFLLHKDHPRLRGEQQEAYGGNISRAGSPPLARGTAWRRAQRHRREGITPACAGNRLALLKGQVHKLDHPRLRGEQCLNSSITIAIVGSPPLARGTVNGNEVSMDAAGITPACAGNSDKARG